MMNDNQLWQQAADDIHWFRAPTRLLDDSRSEEHTSEL